eukprot:11215150-Lingulodinium_polyedra.AAC.1
MRHTGPSFDLAMRFRTYDEVKLRGRWRSDRCCKRYLKDGRVGEQMQRLPHEIQQAALGAPGRLAALLG